MSNKTTPQLPTTAANIERLSISITIARDNARNRFNALAHDSIGGDYNGAEAAALLTKIAVHDEQLSQLARMATLAKKSEKERIAKEKRYHFDLPVA